ncbi:Hypothetical protein AT6N2_L1958 [Agrobacterium tumefaciens]|nr:Hypothetical protein AT6N2_L1958 [Agrobacterium tumefaciens]
MLKDDAPVFHTNSAGGKDEFPLPERQHRAAHKAGILHPLRDDQEDDGVGEAAAHNGDEGDGQENEGHGELDIGKAHDQHIPEASVITSNKSDSDAEVDSTDDRGETDQQRNLAAGDNAGEHITSERIGAQRMGGISEGFGKARHQVDLVGPARKQHVGKEDGEADDCRQRRAEDEFEIGEARETRGFGSHRHLLRADARIDKPVGDIDQKVDADDHQRQHGDDGLEHRIITRTDGIEGERSEARPVEDALDNDDAAEQPAELQAEIGDERNGTVAQRMFVENLAFTQALGARHHDILRAQRIEHGGAHKADIGGRQDDTHGDRGHDVARKTTHAAGRQPAERDGEQEHEHRGQPEIREGQTDEREDADHLIGRLATRGRRLDAERNGKGN